MHNQTKKKRRHRINKDPIEVHIFDLDLTFGYGKNEAMENKP